MPQTGLLVVVAYCKTMQYQSKQAVNIVEVISEGEIEGFPSAVN